MSKIVRYCVLEEEHTGENAFLCHRPYTFGNPFITDKKSKFKGLIKCKTLEECLGMYDIYFDKMLETDPEFKAEFNRLVEAYYKYDVVYLGCYCQLNKRCHTDIIKEKLEKYVTKELIQKLIKERKKC